jgi:hypothetical protein
MNLGKTMHSVERQSAQKSLFYFLNKYFVGKNFGNNFIYDFDMQMMLAANDNRTIELDAADNLRRLTGKEAA